MNQIGSTLPSGNTGGSSYTSSTRTNKPQKDDAQLQQTNSAAGSTNITSAVGTGAAQSVLSAGTNISPAYSVEISKEGSQMNALNASGSGNESPTGKPSASSSGSATSPVNSALTSGSSASGEATSSVESAADDDSASAITNLSQYTDYQLENMLNKGQITQSEYNTEIAKREAKTQTETANAVSTANTNIDTAK